MSKELSEKDPYGITDVELRTDFMGTNSDMLLK
jgi:hypothetical protein